MALWLGAGTMGVSAVLFLLAPSALGRLMTHDPALIAAAVPLLLIAAAFQVTDGLQAVGAGVLRGAGDTRFAFVANLLGHYVLGMPVAIGLGLVAGLGVVGLWIGLALGLCAVAVALILRFHRVSATAIAPVDLQPVAGAP
jgi:multidrug resistance protein, MATE family